MKGGGANQSQVETSSRDSGKRAAEATRLFFVISVQTENNFRFLVFTSQRGVAPSTGTGGERGAAAECSFSHPRCPQAAAPGSRITLAVSKDCDLHQNRDS